MTFGDVLQGLGHGSLALLGVGELYNPLGEKNAELASAIQAQNSMVATESLAAVSAIDTTMKDLYTFQSVMQEKMQKTINFNQDLLLNSLKVENVFISILSVLIIVIVFFMLSQKKCC